MANSEFKKHKQNIENQNQTNNVISHFLFSKTKIFSLLPIEEETSSNK